MLGGPSLRLGTRGSALARAQSGRIADDLRALGASVELVVIRTTGDDRPPNTIWGEGAFVVALEAALLDGRIDVAVHSAKDVPTAQDSRLAIAAFPPREDPRDALVCREAGAVLATLPAGALIGTDSPRRAAFLRASRPDLRTRPLHGNVDTRLRKLADGDADALVLAVAGLRRLGLEGRISEALPVDVTLPAPGQGSLAVEVRADDPVASSLVSRLDDPATRAAVEAERAFLRASGGGCRAPIGALATVEGDTITIRGAAAAQDAVPAGDAPLTQAALAPGTTFTGAAEATLPPPRVVWGERSGPVADRVALAAELAAELATELATELAATIGAAVADPGPAARLGTSPRVLVTREPGRPGALADALRARGLEPIVIPTIELRPAAPGGALDAAVADLPSYAWVVVTSAAGADAIADATARVGVDLATARVAAVGAATADALAARGAPATFVPARTSGLGIGDELPIAPGDRVLLARADAAGTDLPGRLRARAAVVEEVAAYQTVEAPESARAPLRALFAAGGVDAIVLASGSAARGLLALLGPIERRAALATPACCIGPTTAAAARDAGFARVAEATAASSEALADIVTRIIPGASAPAGVSAPAVVVASAPRHIEDPR
jgi:hydroxymethylbilane synthase